MLPRSRLRRARRRLLSLPALARPARSVQRLAVLPPSCPHCTSPAPSQRMTSTSLPPPLPCRHICATTCLPPHRARRRRQPSRRTRCRRRRHLPRTPSTSTTRYHWACTPPTTRTQCTPPVRRSRHILPTVRRSRWSLPRHRSPDPTRSRRAVRAWASERWAGRRRSMRFRRQRDPSTIRSRSRHCRRLARCRHISTTRTRPCDGRSARSRMPTNCHTSGIGCKPLKLILEVPDQYRRRLMLSRSGASAIALLGVHFCFRYPLRRRCIDS